MKLDAGHALLFALFVGAALAAVDNRAERDDARQALHDTRAVLEIERERSRDLRADLRDARANLRQANASLRDASARASHYRHALTDQRSRENRVATYLGSRFGLSTDGATVLAQHIVDAAARARQRYGVSLDATMLAAQIATESSWRPDVRSSAGAVGLMQVMPAHVGRYGFLHSVDDLLNPRLNIRAGAFVLAEALQRYRNPRAALRAYHGGPQAVRDPKPVTRDYERVVMQRWQDLQS